MGILIHRNFSYILQNAVNSVANFDGCFFWFDMNIRMPVYFFVSDIAANEQLRKQTSVSLNLKARKEERARLDADRLARENARRTSLGQPALKSAEDLETEEAPDVVLDQAAEAMESGRASGRERE